MWSETYNPSISATEEVPPPPNLQPKDKAAIDDWWRHEASEFCSAITGTPDNEQPLDQHIQNTVINEWEDGKYGDIRSKNLTLLTPKVNRAVERLMQEYVDTATWDGDDAGAQARAAYMKGHRGLYMRMWLSAHQTKANDELREYIRELWMMGYASGREDVE
ncbi:MAG: hypothetical protein LQ338_004731 [Usnochroma carphineum]|nr:MAG: hypothetical protein LQ338_004731 [Usnochroma carphineum]